MKNKIALLMAGILVASALTACNGQSASESATEASSDSAAAAGSTDESAQNSTGISALENLENLETMALAEINPDDFVTLGEYKGVTVEVASPVVTDEQVEEQINSIFASNPPMTQITDRAVQDGDTVNIDYEGKYADTGVAFDGGTAQGASLVIGSNTYIDGFESGLVGVNVGDTVDLNLTFPENYGNADLAGKEVIFTVKVNSISVASDEMTDEWAAGLGAEGVTTIDGLKDYVRKNLTEEAESQYQTTLENAVLTKVTENCEFKEVPQNLYNRYLIQQNETLEYYASMYSMYMGQQLTASDIITMMMQNEGSTETPDEYLKAVVTESTDQFIMFAAIAKKEGIEVTDEDIDTYLKNAYESSATTAYSSYEEFKATIDPEVYREGLLAEKIVAYLVENANVVEPATQQ